MVEITTTTTLSEVMEGTGCLSAKRFVGKCHECKIVMRCPNEQAHLGRIKMLEIKKEGLLKKLADVDALLEQEKTNQ